jgi:hypothetical protein
LIECHVAAHDRQLQVTAERIRETLERGNAQAGAAGLGLRDRGLGAAETLSELALSDACVFPGPA